MINKILIKNIAMVSLIIAMFFLGTSCKNDVKEVIQATESVRLPLRVQYGIHYEYSDSAKIKLEMKAGEAIDFSDRNPPYQEFPQGIHVIFFDDDGNEEASIKANYAKNFPEDRMWEARGNVEVKNNKNEQLNSEELFWDEKKGIIYSKQFVKITTDESIIMGNGFEADQSFETWDIFETAGTIQIEENETDTSKSVNEGS